MKTPGHIVTFTNSSPSFTANLFLLDVKFKPEIIPFQRNEFSNKRLREVPNADGSLPVITRLSGNRPFQYFTNCNANETNRPLGPNTSNLANIYKRWDIRKYDLDLGPSTAAAIQNMYGVAATHKALYSEFETHLQIASNEEVDYLYMVNTLQAQNFSYITTTSLSMTSRALPFGDESNCLIREFDAGVAYAIKQRDGTSTTIYPDGHMTVEVFTLTTAVSGVF